MLIHNTGSYSCDFCLFNRIQGLFLVIVKVELTDVDTLVIHFLIIHLFGYVLTHVHNLDHQLTNLVLSAFKLYFIFLDFQQFYLLMLLEIS
jgi:hypothetical protein